MPSDVATVASVTLETVYDFLSLYFTESILVGALALWLLRRVALWFRGLH